MQGLLAQQPAQPVQPVQPAAPAQSTTLQQQTAQQANISDADLQSHIKNIVLAAQHVMYSPETRQHFMQEVAAKIKQMPPPAAAASIAVNLILTLIGQSKFKMNPKAVVPAGIIISGDILAFIEKATHKPMNEKDAHATVGLFVKGILAKIGA
jgi:hypothetical protein